MHMQFSALSVYFSSSSSDTVGSRRLPHAGFKEVYPHKSRYFTIVGTSSACSWTSTCCLP